MKSILAGAVFLVYAGLAHGAAALYHVSPGGSGWPCSGPAGACDAISTVLNHTTADDVTIRLATGSYTDTSIIDANKLQVLNISGGWDAAFAHQSCRAESTQLLGAAGASSMSVLTPAGTTLGFELSCLSIESVLSTNRIGLGLSVAGGSLSVSMQQLIFEHIAGNAISISTLSGSINLEIEKSVFKNAYQPTGESKWVGGAISADAYGGSTQSISLENCLLYNNRAVQGAAINLSALSAASSSINLSLTNSTLFGNHSIGPDIGGAINATAFNSGQIVVNLQNTIVWGNDNAGEPRDIYISKNAPAVAEVNARYSDIGEVHLPGSSPGVYNDNGNNLNVDPLLDQRFRLSDASPVIDQAQCGYANAFNIYFRVAPYEDIDGEQRPGWGRLTGCDMGADELVSGFCVPFKTVTGNVGVFCL